jgi:hypothetical protein
VVTGAAILHVASVPPSLLIGLGLGVRNTGGGEPREMCPVPTSRFMVLSDRC